MPSAAAGGEMCKMGPHQLIPQSSSAPSLLPQNHLLRRIQVGLLSSLGLGFFWVPKVQSLVVLATAGNKENYS